MAWRGVLLSRPARLRRDQGCCIVETGDGTIRLAFEDIAYLVLDSHEVSLSSAILASLAEANVLVVACDARHLPTGALLPLQGHFRQVGTLRLQLAATVGLKSRLWQRLVAQKIINQATTLRLLDRPGYRALESMAARVETGDRTRVEARAARDYFARLFEGFQRRREGDVRNAMLNYAYAVLRAGLARGLAAQGFHPALGIEHDGIENAFNLADDLIEPFRPIADRHVANHLAAREDSEDLTVDDRREMARLLVAEVGMGSDTVSILTAIERMADGLVAALRDRDSDLLPLPLHID